MNRCASLTMAGPLPSQGNSKASALDGISDILVEQPHTEAGGALVVGRPRLVRPGHAGDIQVRPGRFILDETLEKLRRGDRSALTRADMLRVGDRRVDRPVIGLAH